MAQGWFAADFSRQLQRRKPQPDRSHALSWADIEQLLTREDIALRDRVLWRMAYETAARSAEALGLDAEDLDRGSTPPPSARRHCAKPL
jgi:integrase